MVQIIMVKLLPAKLSLSLGRHSKVCGVQGHRRVRVESRKGTCFTTSCPRRIVGGCDRICKQLPKM